jgi:LysM repeat protein
MKIFNPVSVTVTLGVHLLAGGVLLFTQGCQSGMTLPDPAEPPPVIHASELNHQTKRTWDDNRLKEPTRPVWAQSQGSKPSGAEEWNPSSQDFSNLKEIQWGAVSQESADKTGVKQGPKSVPYTVASGDSLTRIARNHGTTVAELKSANGLTSDTIRIGQELIVPVGGAATGAGQTEKPSVTPVSGVTHKVVAGDSLSRIARQHHVTIAALKAANGLNNDTIRIGQELVIPNGKQSSAPASAPVAAREAPVVTPIAAGESITHKVVAGELLSTIARKYGTTVSQIKQDNGISDERRLQVNQELVIRAKPKAGETASAPKTPAPTTTLRETIQVRETVIESVAPAVSSTPAPVVVEEQVDTTLSQDENAILEELMSSEDAGVNTIRN